MQHGMRILTKRFTHSDSSDGAGLRQEVVRMRVTSKDLAAAKVWLVGARMVWGYFGLACTLHTAPSRHPSPL